VIDLFGLISIENFPIYIGESNDRYLLKFSATTNDPKRSAKLRWKILLNFLMGGKKGGAFNPPPHSYQAGEVIKT